jgi:hypothetical protein
MRSLDDAPLDDASLERSVTWTLYPLDDASLELSATWKLYPLDDASPYALTLTWDWGEMDDVIIRSEHIVQRMHSPKDASSKRRIVQETNRLRDVRPRTHHPKDVSSQVRIDLGTFPAMFPTTLIIPAKYSRLIFSLIRSSKLCKLSLDFLHFYI